ncbi:hypothetical protein N8T08_003131 [Aspergillus melleus]|uniref:Uncharacterized protein n=1 Tax=Aspergillus melleus TaxID=138277 RepID=A0ACC3B734_9EURO|nr:hypothetical protein N8T08_003131 [Aspergillus melleus]
MSAAAAAPLPPDEDRSSVYIGTTIGFMIPAGLILILRVGVRTLMTKNMSWDDWLMITAMLFLIGGEVLSIISAQHGLGRHIMYLAPEDMVVALKMNTIAQPLNILGLFFVKASIVALLIRLKCKTLYKAILYTSVALLLVVSIVGVVVAFAQCRPFEKNWFVTMPGSCWSRDVFTDALYTLQAITIVTDLCYIIIPIFMLWNVQMAKSTKLSVLGVIGLGAISMVCSIIAIPFAHQLGVSVDVTWEIVDLACIKIAEVNVAVIVGCLPPLQPIFKKVNQRFFSQKTVTNNTYEDRLARLKLKPSEYEVLSGKSKNSRKPKNELDSYDQTFTSDTTKRDPSIDGHEAFLLENGAAPAIRPNV